MEDQICCPSNPREIKSQRDQSTLKSVHQIEISFLDLEMIAPMVLLLLARSASGRRVRSITIS